MGGVTEFETLEHQFLELIAEFRTITVFEVYFPNCLCVDLVYLIIMFNLSTKIYCRFRGIVYVNHYERNRLGQRQRRQVVRLLKGPRSKHAAAPLPLLQLLVRRPRH